MYAVRVIGFELLLQPFSEEDERLMALLDEHYFQYPCEGKIKRAKWLSMEVDYPVGKQKCAATWAL